MWVGFLQIGKIKCPSSFFLMRGSRKSSALSVSVCVVNCVFLFILFICVRNVVSKSFPCGQIAKHCVYIAAILWASALMN